MDFSELKQGFMTPQMVPQLNALVEYRNYTPTLKVLQNIITNQEDLDLFLEYNPKWFAKKTAQDYIKKGLVITVNRKGGLCNVKLDEQTQKFYVG